MDVQTAEQEKPDDRIVHLGRLAKRALEIAQRSYEAEVGAILQMEVEDRGLPETTQFDPRRGVFVVPA